MQLPIEIINIIYEYSNISYKKQLNTHTYEECKYLFKYKSINIFKPSEYNIEDIALFKWDVTDDDLNDFVTRLNKLKYSNINKLSRLSSAGGGLSSFLIWISHSDYNPGLLTI